MKSGETLGEKHAGVLTHRARPRTEGAHDEQLPECTAATHFGSAGFGKEFFFPLKVVMIVDLYDAL